VVVFVLTSPIQIREYERRLKHRSTEIGYQRELNTLKKELSGNSLQSLVVYLHKSDYVPLVENLVSGVIESLILIAFIFHKDSC